MERRLIETERSVIVAADVSDLEVLRELVRSTCDVKGIGGYKVGLELVIPNGLIAVVYAIREYTDLPIIYDHQKGGTDIPEIGEKFAKSVKLSGVDAVILFPFGGAATEEKWIKACQREGLVVLVGGHMTQEKFLASEGGFIADTAPEGIYSIAAKNGVRDFVVPGNKVEFVQKYRELLENSLGKGNFVLYAPGFIAQGGNISETGKVAGDNWHAIVGSAIYKAKDMKKAAESTTSQIALTTIELRTLEILGQSKAIITQSHIVYASGKHGSEYVNKDAVYPDTQATDELCGLIAEHFKDANVEVVVAPAVGGVILSHEVASQLTKADQKVIGIYADKEGDSLVFKRGYGEFIKERRILVVDDVLTTGGSVAKLVELSRSLGGEVVAVAVLCNRGGVKAEDIGNMPELFALSNVRMADYDEAECPLCKAGIPINTEVGKGKEYLEKKAKTQ